MSIRRQIVLRNLTVTVFASRAAFELATFALTMQYVPQRIAMRLPLIPPAELSPEQKSLCDEMRKGIASNFNAFKVEREDGALMGPWNPWLHEPAIGKAIWDLTLAMTANASLPDSRCRSAVRCRLRNIRPYRGRRAGGNEAGAPGGTGERPEAERPGAE
jgi:hypothetical protein